MARNTYYQTAHWKALRKEAIKRAGGRCTVPGCIARGTHVDHRQTRPNVSHPTPLDVIDNLRVLCGSHDSQVKEQANGKRANDGKLKVIGCDVTGRPKDPSHPWR